MNHSAVESSESEFSSFDDVSNCRRVVVLALSGTTHQQRGLHEHERVSEVYDSSTSVGDDYRSSGNVRFLERDALKSIRVSLYCNIEYFCPHKYYSAILLADYYPLKCYSTYGLLL